ncbi:MAG: lipid-binding SYLF domain-containing protein [Candidatus Electronema sp. V4]|uniref:lipid-binding SYLF domain-containing protein n=1 Tax=Candidatus Electronema sp. V4 TaxID=3454756 RepID=UPI0040554AEB
MLPLRLPVFALLLSLLALPCSGSRAAAGSLNDAEALVLKSNAVFRSFMNDPNLVWFHDYVDSAKGIMIVPQMLRGGFIVGGSGGSGALLARSRNGSWSCPAFYTVGSLSFGLQAGADASELVLLVMTEEGLNALLSTELKLGADISVAAGPVGKNAKAQTADVLVFGRSKGVFGGVSVEGAVLAPRYDWNRAYYYSTELISPMDILIKQRVSNRQAELLRRSLPGGSRPHTLSEWREEPYGGYPASPNYGYDAPAYPPPAAQDYPGTGGSGWRNPDESWRNPDQNWRNPDALRQQELPEY